MSGQQMIPGDVWPVAPSDPTAATMPWWDATREKRLVVQACSDCGHRQHHPRAICTSCGATDLGVIEASGRGRIASWTVVHRAPDPRLAVPYVLALVDLDEGPRLLTRLWHPDVPLARAAGLAEVDLCDVPVEVAWVPVEGDDLHLPVFVPQLTIRTEAIEMVATASASTSTD